MHLSVTVCVVVLVFPNGLTGFELRKYWMQNKGQLVLWFEQDVGLLQLFPSSPGPRTVPFSCFPTPPPRPAIPGPSVFTC